MKLSIVFLLVGVLQASASLYSQNTKLNISLDGKSIKDVFREIEKQSHFHFLYNDDFVDLDRIVSLNMNGSKVEDILQTLFEKANVTFKVLDNNLIVITPAEIAIFQQSRVSGIVTDASTGEALPGVNIVVEGTTLGVVSDIDGHYSIDMPATGGNLVFSYVGYTTKTVAAGGQKEINVTLEPDVQSLEEVVVVGYGTQTKKDISGSVTNISERNFNKGVTQNAVDLLQGKVAGLVITRGSGDVTSEQTVRLRGTSSLTGSSQPFVVVDGVPGMSLNSVAPQDIESISILKDASAGAIYGSRSASGVILITTKKGKTGKASIQYEGYAAIDQVSNKPDMLTAAEWRDYCQKNNINTSGLDKGANTDWFDEIMRTGKSQNHSLSLSGGNEKSNYRASFSYLDRQGVVKANELQRLNGRVTFSQKALNNKLNVTFTGAGIQTDYKPMDTYNFVLAYNMLPVYPVKNADGTWFDSREYDQGNPVRNLELNTRQHKTNLYYTNMKTDLEIIKDFTAGLNLFKQREMDDYSEYNNSETQRGRDDQGYAKRESWTRDKNLLEFTLNYQKRLEKHNFGILGGYSYEDSYYQKSGAQNRQFATDLNEADNLGAGQNLRSGDVWSEKNMYKLISFFGRINYSFDEKYILTATLRKDGSSKFGKNNKWGTFPSVSLAWRLSAEPFMNSISSISDLKIRAGYGVTGNQDGLDPYKSLALYGATGKYYDDGKWYSAYAYSQNPNPNLRWEETAMFNVGIDYDLFEGRINGSVEYYNKETSNLLYEYSVPVPPYLKDKMIANVGSMTNKGIEVLINGDVIRKKDLRWSLSVNFAHNKNEITKLSNDEFTTSSIKTGDAWVRGGSYNTTSIVEEGKEVGTFYGWRCLGLDSNGKYIMDDMVDGKPGLTDDDRTYIGSAQPKLTYGIASNLNWKNWDFSMFFRGVYGNDVLNFSKMSYATTQWLPGANVLKEAITSGLTDNPKYCSYYIEKGSFLRLDNASLGYNFNTNNYLGIERFRVYITGQNLFVITKYKGLDPEVDMKGLAPGIEGREYYPKTRTISVGVNLSF